ncbi:MAG: BrnA antitoxin family protein [Solidesulfovibrio sp. DCME]|uniref:BrnA antitoxin family protein n=1 Tax=Solidesulfovibrio sp. DCME TaxID=3447380 RepID=UPI003D0C0BC8
MPTKYKENGKAIVRYTEEELREMESQTDWKRVDAMTDEELTANALSDPDNPPLPDDFFEKAKRVRLEDLLPEAKERVCIRLDRDVLAWFRGQKKKGYQTAINAVLRAFVESQEGGKRA